MDGFKIALDSRSERVVHIDDVDEGFQYGVCPDCKSHLVASNRNKRTRKIGIYFRHKSISNCKGETLIHLWAKQIIADKEAVFGAEYRVASSTKDISGHYHRLERRKPPEELKICNVHLEERLTNESNEVRKPDIMSDVIGGAKLAIEVFVNNAVGQLKESFFIKEKLDCLEVDLSGLDSQILNSPEEFEKYVIKDAPRKWVYCARYKELDFWVEKKSKEYARLANNEIRARRDEKRKLRTQWREEHSDFMSLVNAYMIPDNRKYAEHIYHNHYLRPGTISNSYKKLFDSNFDGLKNIINVPVKGELAFNCHRSAWQWEVYKIIVLYSLHKYKHSISMPIRRTWATRGYDDAVRMLSLYDNTPKWTPGSLYGSIRKVIPLNKISLELERLVGMELITESDKPEGLYGLTTKEWNELPKPVCAIRRYVKTLVSKSLIEVYEGDTYIVNHDAIVPLEFDVSRFQI